MSEESHFWLRSPTSCTHTSTSLFEEKKVVHPLFEENTTDPFEGDTDVSFFEYASKGSFSDLHQQYSPKNSQRKSANDCVNTGDFAVVAESASNSRPDPTVDLGDQELPTTAENHDRTKSANDYLKSLAAETAVTFDVADPTKNMSDGDPPVVPPPAPSADRVDLDKYKSEDSNVDLWCTSSSAMKDQKNQIPAATLERMSLMKNVLGQKIDRRKKDKKEEQDRQDMLEDKMSALGLSDEAKQQARLELKQEELRIRFHQSKRLGVQDFESLALLGRGAFGEVHLVRMKPSNEMMAMKSMDKRSTVMKNQVQHVHSEKNVLAESSSTWIVQLHASFQDKHMLHLLMDFMPGGDLMELLIKYDIFTEDATKQYVSELMIALKHVHALGYIHRDIKPDNLLIDARGHIKLTDLGLCKKIGNIETEGIKKEEFNPDLEDDEDGAPKRKGRHVQAFSVVGTPDYIAPEVLLQEGYGAESDMWSMGVIMFECLLGYTPFHGDNPLTITRKIVNWRTVLRFPRSRIKNLSPECMHFMRSLICDSPDRLGKKGGIGEIQKHPWLEGVPWDHLRDQPAPYKPVIADNWEELLDEIKPLEKESPRFKEIVVEITSHFPDAGNHLSPPMFQGKRQPQHKDQNFMGFEYRRKPKVKHALLDD